MIETNLAQTVNATNVKYLLSDKQILSMGYTEAEYKKAENALYANA